MCSTTNATHFVGVPRDVTLPPPTILALVAVKPQVYSVREYTDTIEVLST